MTTLAPATVEAMSKKARIQVLKDRMVLERDMGALFIPWVLFGLIIIFFFMGLFIEIPFQLLHEIKLNLSKNFKLDDVADINTFTGVYEYLADFMEAADRFDPLNRERFVARRYGKPQNVSDGGGRKFFPDSEEDVTIIREKKFFAVSALIIRPMIMMQRGTRVPCTQFAAKYDKLYSMARYLRYKFRGKKLDGGWQPERVWFASSHEELNNSTGSVKEISVRGPHAGGPSYLSSYTTQQASAMGSRLLMCVDRQKANDTMRTKLKDRYHNIKIDRDDETFFGDFLTEGVDILAYLGYKVYDYEIDEKAFPRCFTTDRRDPVTGETLPNGTKVTLKDVDKRCDRSGDRWHDVQTSRIQAQVFLYTPVVEVFTRIKVDFRILDTGLFSNEYQVKSFRMIRRTQDWPRWCVITVVQAVLSILQIIVLLVLARQTWRDGIKFPRASNFDKLYCTRVTGGIVLQLLFMSFFIYSFLDAVDTGGDLWEILERYLSINPYDKHQQAGESAEAALADLIEYSKKDSRIRVWAFCLVILSIFQVSVYMKAHPLTALMISVVRAITWDIVHFLIIFFILFFMLFLLGAWSFGADLKVFSTIPGSLVQGTNWVLGWDVAVADGYESLPDGTDRALLIVWELCCLIFLSLFMLNFLLAIIVDGYMAAKRATIDNEAENDFLTDLVYVSWATAKRWYNNWPIHSHVLEATMDLNPKNTEATSADLVSVGLFDSVDDADRFIDFYCRIQPSISGSVDNIRRTTRKSRADCWPTSEAPNQDGLEQVLELLVEKERELEACRAELRVLKSQNPGNTVHALM